MWQSDVILGAQRRTLAIKIPASNKKNTQWYRISVNKIPPTIDSLFATSLQVVGFQWATRLESVRWQRDHAKTTGIVEQRRSGVFRCVK
jgi:hypothetical protein